MSIVSLMDVLEIQLIEGPLPGVEPPVGEIGALLEFRGIVRGLEDGKPIAGLEYQVYEPMTSRELRRLAESVAEEFPVKSVIVHHSYGFVPTGRESFFLAVGSRHRLEGLRFVERFIAEMKASVPIWKLPVYPEP